MVLWISIAVLVVGIILLIIDSNTYKYDWLVPVGVILVTIGMVATILIGSIAACNHLGIEGKIAAYQERYEILTEQWENEVYENDNDIGKRELIEDIQSWNEDLTRNQANQDNFWIGVFIPDIYDLFEPIELYNTSEVEGELEE